MVWQDTHFVQKNRQSAAWKIGLVLVLSVVVCSRTGQYFATAITLCAMFEASIQTE